MHSLSSNRVVLALVVAFALTLAMLGVSASTASALPRGYQPNGCTLSPDRGWYPTYYDFKSSCNSHDYCYDEMWFGGGENGRAGCDNWFLNSMRGWCSGSYSSWWQAVDRTKCYGVAVAYYGAVRNLGRPYFNNPYLN